MNNRRAPHPTVTKGDDHLPWDLHPPWSLQLPFLPQLTGTGT